MAPKATELEASSVMSVLELAEERERPWGDSKLERSEHGVPMPLHIQVSSCQKAAVVLYVATIGSWVPYAPPSVEQLRSSLSGFRGFPLAR